MYQGPHCIALAILDRSPVPHHDTTLVATQIGVHELLRRACFQEQTILPFLTDKATFELGLVVIHPPITSISSRRSQAGRPIRNSPAHPNQPLLSTSAARTPNGNCRTHSLDRTHHPRFKLRIVVPTFCQKTEQAELLYSPHTLCGSPPIMIATSL
jgi:hypothetical protein